MNYEAIEKSILDKIKPAFVAAGFFAQVMPEVKAELKTTTQKGAVYVSYQGSTFDQTSQDPRHLSTGPTSQKEVLNFEITVEAAKLRGVGGVHKAIEYLRALLVGFRPVNCHKLYLTGVRPDDYIEGVWSWKVLMACTSAVVEDFDETDGQELLRQIMLENETSGDDIGVPGIFIKANETDYLVSQGTENLTL